MLVVEDKQPYLETLVRDALYGTTDAPAVLGKLAADATPLVPLAGAVTAETLVEPLRRVLGTRIPAERLQPNRRDRGLSLTIAPEALRTPFFCSGCPHNTGTRVPDGALVGAGIGCHGMITLMGAEGRGEIIGITQMGGEGSQWIGIAPFVDDPHLFQNLGDGTYCHSGQLAVQAAIAADVTITFKLLYNAAVAMTGGQDATGLLPVPQVATKLVAEGVREIIITTEDLGRYRGRQAPRPDQGVGPRPDHRGPGAPAGGAGRDRAHPRPAVRGREAPRPQAGPAAHARLAGRDRRAGLRGVRRLRRPVQLPQPADRRAPSSAARPSSTRPAATST